MPKTIYIATAYPRAQWVEEVIRPLVESRRLHLASSWHVGAHGVETLDRMTEAQVRAIADANDRQIVAADAVLVLWDRACGETLCELRYAATLGKTVAYVGPRFVLSAYRDGVRRFSDVRDAVTWLAGVLHASREPDFTTVFRPSSPPGPDTLPARADEDIERELAAGGGR